MFMERRKNYSILFHSTNIIDIYRLK